MPLFKVAVVPNRSRKITCCAGSIRELIEKSLSALSAAVDADSYEAYDDSDCLIADDECLIALAEDRRAARSGLQEVTLVPHGQAWPGSGSSGPDKDVNRPASSSVPTITVSSEDVALLRKAVESPPHLRTRALLRAKRKVVQHLVDKLKASPPAPGDIRKICERVKVACPNAFVLAIRENEVGDSFLPFVKSVYNSLGYALCCDGSKARRRRRRAQTDEEDADDPALQTVVLHCTDSNGCAEGMWGPSFSPEEKEQFASIQQSLLTDYSAAQFGPLDSGVVDLVKECFPLTRSDINDARTAADWKKVFTSWPVLQHYEPFLAHANLLMGKVCEEVWADSFADPLPLVKFMTDYCSPVDGKPCATERLTSMNLFLKKSAEAVEQRENNGPMKDVAFPFLVYYFREKMDLLFLLVDVRT
ncbi:uncharacterized protein LOC117642865 [Thrips palmi]|uniref:Uncharacterized protein LOC117642865 n=1 Tax=Thrips palmi TaxID=161013 RepID=A0A6P8YKT1_THRPL|nr:uncharacterized protein LOC117642865 [Thrips palmi]